MLEGYKVVDITGKLEDYGQIPISKVGLAVALFILLLMFSKRS